MSNKNRKILNISDKSKKKLEFLKEVFECSENSVFIIALNKLYKDYINNDI